MGQEIYIREAFPEEDSLIAEHFYQMWLDNDVPSDSIESDWLDITLQFIEGARKERCYKAFVAEVDGRAIASASCQLFAGLYPHILKPEYRNYGYIWGVYVEPPHRRQGLAKKLTLCAIDHLKSLNCTRVILHASPSGKPVYSSLGFSETNGMRLDLM
ncbi:GNAT family N-acetyltransferase [Coleofasciculus sp. FACHB-1120]|uniref:GNAT family N-acetyltransferase n=1 Tax=Coleofasciculus sp. FACHB-1120 TaxID=2692783 RepID=UPI00168213DE|nr:GNAT family N-acetyltransferase [Coleofasciculus sp. FACHB-1120]MBD2740368.1 GNAT family N-acetyltransferase [Coleofasciculus sp. FACHB-1120]